MSTTKMERLTYCRVLRFVNHGPNETSMYGSFNLCEILGCKLISLTCATMRTFCKRYVMHTLTNSTTTLLETKRLIVRELRNSGLPTNLKLATCAAISEGTPRVPLLVGMSLLLLAALARLSRVSGILRSRFPPTADRASIADRLLRFCCASISGLRSTMTRAHIA